jgi:hypothetical protein
MEHDWRNPERVAPWKTRQRFRVSSLGEEAARRYRSAMEEAQQAPDARAALERAKQEWATTLALRPGDGILLEEMVGGRTSLAELLEILETLGTSLREARGTLDRLVAGGLIEPLQTASAPGPPPLRGGPM